MASAPVEQKVKAATSATFVVSLLIAVLNAVVADDSLLQPLPAWLQALLIPLVPAAITFLSGWKASHTPRGPVSGS
ncbi:holin [Streptomyces sp. NPDC094149]|uniref:holin n=1 Tax=Streptomyces sp. NPDC094149 TaxID=3155079 RepID=UPI0033335401